MQRVGMGPTTALLLLALVVAASAQAPASCKQTVSGNKKDFIYKCSFCNEKSYALKTPRLNCTNFQNTTNRNNIGYTSPFCYITQANRIDPHTCTNFNFRNPITSANVTITFDNSTTNSAILTPVTGENFLKCFLEQQTFFRSLKPNWFEYDCYLRNGGLKFARLVLPCSFPKVYQTEGRFQKLNNGSCIVRQTLGFNDMYKFGVTVDNGTWSLGTFPAAAPPPPS